MATGTIGQRFLQLIKHLGISKNAFAQSLDKTATVVQHLVDERNKPGYDLLCKVFEVYPSVSKDWLLLGQGPMLLAGGSGAAANAPLATSPAAIPTPVAPAKPVAATPAVAAKVAPAMPAAPSPAPPDAAYPTPLAAANLAAPPSAPAENYLTAALHAQHLQHQLAMAEQRNQHLLEQQRLMQQLVETLRLG